MDTTYLLEVIWVMTQQPEDLTSAVVFLRNGQQIVKGCTPRKVRSVRERVGILAIGKPLAYILCMKYNVAK
jgi:hypothetical protein